MMELQEIIKAAEDQGWRVEQTRDGYMLYPPDRSKTGVLVHRQPTEQAIKKTISHMRSRDFVWPPPTERKS